MYRFIKQPTPITHIHKYQFNKNKVICLLGFKMFNYFSSYIVIAFSKHESKQTFKNKYKINKCSIHFIYSTINIVMENKTYILSTMVMRLKLDVKHE